jgi:hypothetical protein
MIKKQFRDIAEYSNADRTALSIRDGVLEYLGIELGLDPPDKVFTVYRSPATIANAAYKMPGIPLTNEHVSIEVMAPNTGSSVTVSEVIDQIDEATNTRLAVKNTLVVNDSMTALLADKKQMSLGYMADLIEHSKWDYEQVNIIPHHLAAVPSGRCGPLCSFLDRKSITEGIGEMKKGKINKFFLDEEGAVNLEQIVEIAMALPDAIKKVPVDKLGELIPAMQEIISYSKEQGVEIPAEETEEKPEGDMEEKPVGDMEEKPVEDEDMEEEDKKKFTDADFRKALAKEKKSFADEAVKRFGGVVTKARAFVGENYSFEDKSINQVMRDCLATQSTEKFADNELAVAFKLLRKAGSDYSNFGGTKTAGSLTERIKQTIEKE